MPEEKPVDQLNYEAAFGELESIVATLEGNQRPLDEAMALFERGQALASRCATLLDQAELKIRTLTGFDRTVPLDGEEPEE
jgi:exodeoxyribonuclease VII small subunit